MSNLQQTEVSIHPGASTLTRTRGATDRASDLLNASTPPLTAAKSCGLVPGMPVSTSAIPAHIDDHAAVRLRRKNAGGLP